MKITLLVTFNFPPEMEVDLAGCTPESMAAVVRARLLYGSRGGYEVTVEPLPRATQRLHLSEQGESL